MNSMSLALTTSPFGAVKPTGRLFAIWNGANLLPCCPTAPWKRPAPGLQGIPRYRLSPVIAVAATVKPSLKVYLMPNRSRTGGTLWRTRAGHSLMPLTNPCVRLGMRSATMSSILSFSPVPRSCSMKATCAGRRRMKQSSNSHRMGPRSGKSFDKRGTAASSYAMCCAVSVWMYSALGPAPLMPGCHG